MRTLELVERDSVRLSATERYAMRQIIKLKIIQGSVFVVDGGEPTTDDRRGAYRVAEDLTVTAEGLGDGHGTDLVERGRTGHCAHGVAPSAARSAVRWSTRFRYSAWLGAFTNRSANAAQASGSRAVAAYSRWNASSRS